MSDGSANNHGTSSESGDAIHSPSVSRTPMRAVTDEAEIERKKRVTCFEQAEACYGVIAAFGWRIDWPHEKPVPDDAWPIDIIERHMANTLLSDREAREAENAALKAALVGVGDMSAEAQLSQREAETIEKYAKEAGEFAAIYCAPAGSGYSYGYATGKKERGRHDNRRSYPRPLPCQAGFPHDHTEDGEGRRMSEELSDYERKELAKLRTVMKAASENGCTQDELRIETTGHDPHASVTIKAYVFEKFIAQKTTEKDGDKNA